MYLLENARNTYCEQSVQRPSSWPQAKSHYAATNDQARIPQHTDETNYRRVPHSRQSTRCPFFRFQGFSHDRGTLNRPNQNRDNISRNLTTTGPQFPFHMTALKPGTTVMRPIQNLLSKTHNTSHDQTRIDRKVDT